MPSFLLNLPKKDDETIYEAIHIVKIGNITPKTTIQAKKTKHFMTPTFDKLWINYKRSSGILAIKWQSERLMSKGVRTLYYENNLIFITTEGVEHVSIDDRLFDFSYEL